MRRYVFFLLLTVLITACGERPMYDRFVAIPEQGWHKDSTIHFDVTIDDISAQYYAEVSVRNNSAYPNQNIWFFRNIYSSKGLEYGDTAQYFLANEYGEWTGKGLGELKTNDFPFRRQALRFADTGVYRFSFTQAMRMDMLNGIEDIGLRLYKDNQQVPETNGEEATD
jgi:gliding motility-associated lipoprotein GldH